MGLDYTSRDTSTRGGGACSAQIIGPSIGILMLLDASSVFRVKYFFILIKTFLFTVKTILNRK